MKENEALWRGLRTEAQDSLRQRDYAAASLAQRLADPGVDASALVAAERAQPEIAATWIPGVEIFARTIHPQRHRGSFGEFARREEGALARIGLWPQQWAAARMFGQSAKGFHVHPPHVPGETSPEDWFRRLYEKEPENFSLRPYAEEQWDAMFFVQGNIEIILCDLRAGLPKRTMRFFIDGDNHRGVNNVGVVIPPGVAHALRAEGSEDAIMVYGTSTPFRPEFEGRIAAEIETLPLPESWQRFLNA